MNQRIDAFGWLGLVLVALASVTACTGAACFQGRVVVAETGGSSSHEFVPRAGGETACGARGSAENGEGRWQATARTAPRADEPEPVAGARVIYRVTSEPTTCATAPGGRDTVVHTDASGRFEHYAVFSGATDHLQLCVDHPDFKPYEYSVRYGSDPVAGEQSLVIYLEPREQTSPAAPLAQSPDLSVESSARAHAGASKVPLTEGGGDCAVLSDSYLTLGDLVRHGATANSRQSVRCVRAGDGWRCRAEFLNQDPESSEVGDWYIAVEYTVDAASGSISALTCQAAG